MNLSITGPMMMPGGANSSPRNDVDDEDRARDPERRAIHVDRAVGRRLRTLTTHAGRFGISTRRRNSHTISSRWFQATVST